ncbi:MAG TPA: 4Fe-4S binding protein [Candidatus Dormibacteraeota bacterium]|nr:4Fe-4S binding protein [Candidatus Dormibacteraeota bacterium]
MAGQAQSSASGDDSGVRLTNLRKKLIRRAQPEHSQLLRQGCQFAFLLLNLWVGDAFYFWVRGFETGAHDATMSRPAGVEGWLPIAGLMNFKYWLTTGRIPATHPAAMFLLVSFLAIAFLFRKAFCSWLCPIGTLSEYLWRAGRQIFRRNFQLPRWIDIPLRGLKYLLLGFFVWAVANMSADAVDQFMHAPYGVIADVRMLNFFRDLGETAAIVLIVLAVASVFVQNFWCRYLCPYGALLGLVSLPGPLRIRRTAAACIDCAKCAKVCPSALPVDKLVSIKSAECTGCLECVAVCPAEGALDLSVPRWTHAPKDGRLPAWAMAAGIAVLFVGIVGFAKASGYWNGDVPDSIYRQLVPQANEVSHPAE